jgi:hypothetical protein
MVLLFVSTWEMIGSMLWAQIFSDKWKFNSKGRFGHMLFGIIAWAIARANLFIGCNILDYQKRLEG